MIDSLLMIDSYLETVKVSRRWNAVSRWPRIRRPFSVSGRNAVRGNPMAK